jgi:hypothetical protein
MNITETPTIQALFLSLSLFLSSCEQPAIDGGQDAEKTDEYSISFNINKFEITDFNESKSDTRASVDVSKVCKVINFAVFSGGTRVKIINQAATDDGFGKINVSLAAGTYRIIALAHNCDGNATITDPAKITFKDNKITDTFYYIDDVNVTGEASHDMSMTRGVARFRLIIKDKIPTNVTQFMFYYTGGSSTFSAVDKAGIVNSRQTETLTASEDSIYDVYTFPRADSQTLKIVVTALSSDGKTVAEKTFENVPVAVNKSTVYRGYFFSEGPDSKDEGFSFKVDDGWKEENHDF